MQGAAFGIYTTNNGTGAVSITTQAVTATGSIGISARNNNLAGTGDLTITAQGAVQGRTSGIYALSNGTGAVSITTQAVTGTASAGIDVRNNNAAGTGDLTITAQGAVQGGTRGIYAFNNGAGAVSITTQAVTGSGGDGIGVNNAIPSTGDITILAQGTVTGSANGINANNDGTGGITITSQAVTGTAAVGIVARNTLATGTGDLTITAQGAVQGGNDGIYAVNNGTGALSVTTQAVTGTRLGILARNANALNNTDLTVTAQGAVQGGLIGVYVVHSGTGALSITTQAVTGTANAGIYVRNNNAAGTGDLTITAQGAVQGGTDGIYANTSGTGAITITAQAVTGNRGIFVTRANNSAATLNISGAVTGTGGVAIDLRLDGNDTLNLNPGASINGTIDFGNGNATDIDTLNVAPGVNVDLTFADASGNDSAALSAPENVSSNVVLINGGTTAVAVDPTGFAASGAALGGMTSAIFGAIDTNGSGPQGGTPLTGGIVPVADKTVAYNANQRVWVTGFGGKQSIEGSSSQAGIKNNFGGLVTGVESTLSAKSSFGVFGGYAKSKINLEFNAGDVKTESAFGGAYWKMNNGTFRMQLALVVGSNDQDSTRNVGGVNARGDSDGWFFSPSLTLAAPLEISSFPLVASARVNYAGLFLGGYTETGVANPLTVGDRDVHIFSTRAQLTLPQAIANENGSITRIDWRAGVDAQFDAGSDNVSLTVGGTPLSFSADLDNEVAGFFGSTVSYTSANGFYNLSASGEVQSTFDSGYSLVGQLRGAYKF